jgi:predicted nucleic acid-binding protein
LRLYFDTAYVAKCYLNEPGGGQVRLLASSASGLYSSGWCIPEMACVIHRNFREGRLDADEADAIRNRFRDDVRNGVWSLLPVTERLLVRAELFTTKLAASVYIRAGDLVHLVTAEEAGFTEIWTNDRHLATAAQYNGLTARAV